MDRGSKYDWDRHNKAHIAAHQVEPHEVEEVLANEPIYVETRIDTGNGEERILEPGHQSRPGSVRGVDPSRRADTSGDCL